MKAQTLRFTVLTIALGACVISASGQTALIEQTRIGGATQTSNLDFVFTDFTATTTSDHSTAPGIVSGYSTASRIASTANPGSNGTQVVLSPNGGHGTVSNTETAGTLTTGTSYVVQVSFSSATTAASPDIVVSCSDTGMSGIDTFNGILSGCFQGGNGYNKWIPVGIVTPNTSSPTLTFAYNSGVSGRWNVDSFLFSPLTATPPSGTYQYWTPGAPGAGGSGSWTASAANWNTLANGTGTQGAYVQANLADFTNAAGTVTIDPVNGITTDGGLEFDVSGYTLTGGTLTLGSSSSTSGTNIAVAPGSVTINAPISAPYGLCSAYLGTINLGTAVSFPGATGTVTINTGTVQLSPGVNQSFPSLAGTPVSGLPFGVLSLGSNTCTVGSDNTSTAFAGIIVDGGASAPGKFVKTGTGILTLTGANTFSGPTTINQGAIRVAAASDPFGTQPPTVVTNQLTLNGGRVDFTAVATLVANRGITLGAGGGTLSTPGTGTTPTISGPISGSGSLTIPMGGLDLKASNSFSGGLYITASPIDTGGNGLCSVRFDAEGASGTGKIFISPTTAVNCTLRNFNTLTNIIVPNAMELDLYTNTQTNTQIYLAGGSSATTNIFAITFSGNINGAASVNIGLDTAGGSSNPGGTVNFSGSNTLWTGGATLQAGTLGLGSSNCMGTGGLFLVPQGPAGVLLATTPLIGTNAPTNSIGINTSVSSLTFGGTNSLQLAGPVFLYGSSTLTTTNTASTILSGGISDSTPLSSDLLTIAGSGTLTLSGASTYDGGTTVSAGTLLANNTTGSGTGTGSVSVSFGATFGGTGIISGTVDNFGTIAPGNGPGTLSTADETWEATSIYNWSINKAGGTAGANPGWSQANITGGLNINTSGSPITINLTSLTSSNTPGLVSDFNSGRNYTWSIAHTTAGITNFSTNYFTLNTAGFSNSLGSGSFSITTNATDVLLVFTTPVSAPTISSIQVAGTNLTISGSGGAPGGPYTVVTSTNLTLNLTNWVTVGSSNFNGSGNFSFNGATTTNKQQFYAIEVP